MRIARTIKHAQEWERKLSESWLRVDARPERTVRCFSQLFLALPCSSLLFFCYSSVYQGRTCTIPGLFRGEEPSGHRKSRSAPPRGSSCAPRALPRRNSQEEPRPKWNPAALLSESRRKKTPLPGRAAGGSGRAAGEDPGGSSEPPPLFLGALPGVRKSPRRLFRAPAPPPRGSSWGQEEPQAAIPTHQTTPTTEEQAAGGKQGKETRAGAAAGTTGMSVSSRACCYACGNRNSSVRVCVRKSLRERAQKRARACASVRERALASRPPI